MPGLSLGRVSLAHRVAQATSRGASDRRRASRAGPTYRKPKPRGPSPEAAKTKCRSAGAPGGNGNARTCPQRPERERAREKERVHGSGAKAGGGRRAGQGRPAGFNDRLWLAGQPRHAKCEGDRMAGVRLAGFDGDVKVIVASMRDRTWARTRGNTGVTATRRITSDRSAAQRRPPAGPLPTAECDERRQVAAALRQDWRALARNGRPSWW